MCETHNLVVCQSLASAHQLVNSQTTAKSKFKIILTSPITHFAKLALIYLRTAVSLRSEELCHQEVFVYCTLNLTYYTFDISFSATSNAITQRGTLHVVDQLSLSALTRRSCELCSQRKCSGRAGWCWVWVKKR